MNKYKIGFNLLLDMAYDHIPEEDRHVLDARLKALGL